MSARSNFFSGTMAMRTVRKSPESVISVPMPRCSLRVKADTAEVMSEGDNPRVSNWRLSYSRTHSIGEAPDISIMLTPSMDASSGRMLFSAYCCIWYGGCEAFIV